MLQPNPIPLYIYCIGRNGIQMSSSDYLGFSSAQSEIERRLQMSMVMLEMEVQVVSAADEHDDKNPDRPREILNDRENQSVHARSLRTLKEGQTVIVYFRAQEELLRCCVLQSRSASLD
jgi:hypothetical protein